MESFVIFSIIVILIAIAMVKNPDYQKSSKVNPNDLIDDDWNWK